MGTSIDLTAEVRSSIQKALEEAMPAGLHVRFDDEDVSSLGNVTMIGVKPLEYPETMYAFIEGLAKAEINLRDAGINVNLQPDVRQRMLVIGKPKGYREIAYRTTDGDEYDDLANLLGTCGESLMPMSFDWYAYDSPVDFEDALKEARTEHPDADYGYLAN